MNLLLLGGMSPHNKEWIYKVEKTLSSLCQHTTVLEYAHWNDPTKTMDIDKELAEVGEKAKELNGDYAVFAKSVGVILALRGISGGLIKPQKCFFVGLPLGLVAQENINLPLLLAANQNPTLLAQNTDDPAGSYAEVQTYLKDAPPNYKLIELPGNTHNYDKYTKLKELFAGLL